MQNILKSKILIGVMLMAAAAAATIVIAVSVSHSGSDLQSQLDLGKKYVSELDYENAVIAYEQALEIDPYCLEAYLGLSDAYLALGQQDKAIEILQQAKAMLPDSAQVYVSLAQLYASQNQMELLASTLEEGIAATGSDQLRDMLREYQPEEGEPLQAQNKQQGSPEGEREEAVPEPEIVEEEPEEKSPSISIGLRQDNPQKKAQPVLVINQDTEQPVSIPLVAPATVNPPPTDQRAEAGQPVPGGNPEEGLAGAWESGEEESDGGSPGTPEGSAGNSTDSPGPTDEGTGSGGEENPGSPGDGGDNPGGTEDGDGTVTPPVRPSTGISGNVYGMDGEGIQGVTVNVYTGQSQIPVEVNTDNIGAYIQELPAGTYTIVLSKDGYEDLSTTVTVTGDSLASNSYLMLTTEESRQSASLKGVVISATDSQNVEGATIAVLTGFDQSSNGDQSIIQGSAHGVSGSNGEFSIDQGLNAGYYTIEASKDGYSTYHRNETIKPGENEFTINMSPEIQTQGEYRIVLTWGESPRDLDSHLVCNGEDGYHIYYGNKNSGDGNASLDRDDVTSYGPETITVKIGGNNSYIYAVHNYSNGWATPGQPESLNLSNSQAKVMVYAEDGLIFNGNIPANQEGTTWEVFRIENGRLVVTNTISFEHPREWVTGTPRAATQEEEKPGAASAGNAQAASLCQEEGNSLQAVNSLEGQPLPKDQQAPVGTEPDMAGSASQDVEGPQETESPDKGTASQGETEPEAEGAEGEAGPEAAPEVEAEPEAESPESEAGLEAEGPEEAGQDVAGPEVEAGPEAESPGSEAEPDVSLEGEAGQDGPEPEDKVMPEEALAPEDKKGILEAA